MVRLILKNLLRNKKRTALTVLSFGFSLFLLVALATFLNALINPPESDASILRLAVRRSTSLAEQMPLAYAERLKRIPHVADVMPLQWFGGYYQEPRNMLATLALDPKQFLEFFPEIETTPADKAAFVSERRGALVGPTIMNQFGWHVGQMITIKGNIFPVDLEIKIVGTYHNVEEENAIYINWDYLHETLGKPGKIGAFWVKADAKENVPGIAAAIDATFRNSPAETKTETERAFRLGFVSMLGNVKLIIGSIACVVVFTMLLVVTSTMAMTIRERMREVAILKTVGYRRIHILLMIVGEGLAIALMGWVLGYLFCVGLGHMDTNRMTQGFVPKFNPPAMIYALTMAVGLMIGLISGLIPGLQASALTISEAMRKLE
ncbi:FtsX-like permease family protein [bacterium]|nr:FtsX-like permease family protein [bacterium]